MKYAGYVENEDRGNQSVGREGAKDRKKKDNRGHNPQHPGLKGFNDVKNDLSNVFINAIKGKL